MYPDPIFQTIGPIVSVDAAGTSMRVDLYDRKGGLLAGTVLPL